MASSSRMLAAAVLVVLFVGAMCEAPVTFTVEKGSDEKNLALSIKYNKAGDSMAEVELKEHGSNEWLALKKNGDGVWEIKSDKPLKGPFNFRFVSEKGMRNVFDDVVPAEFKVGTTYKPEE
ncbi:pollen allergen Lol p 2-A-like [Lolium rigidum]|uniref:pollen allergen Lol p 2-A-like n=1 Tax=Lolium rigidum TaxID=89674 RepID=UPI001F5CA175|nr:pollen allergen Lol p 2-A-like [Lolium rigidum]